MSNASVITDKIFQDASLAADRIREDAAKKADEIISLASSEAASLREKSRIEVTEKAKEMLQSKITLSNLEVKKLILKAKRDVIEKAFSLAVTEIKKDREGYKKMIASMLSAAEDGDTVTISESDKDIIEPAFITEISKKAKIKVSVNSEYGAFSGGIVISGNGYDKNFSLETLLSSAKDEHEQTVAKLLFGA